MNGLALMQSILELRERGALGGMANLGRQTARERHASQRRMPRACGEDAQARCVAGSSATSTMQISMRVAPRHVVPVNPHLPGRRAERWDLGEAPRCRRGGPLDRAVTCRGRDRASSRLDDSVQSCRPHWTAGALLAR